MTLRQRLLAVISIILLISLIGGSVLTYWQSVRQVALEMSAAINVGESTVNDAIANLSQSNDAEQQVARIVAAFDGDRHLSARLVASDGSERLASRIKPAAAPAPSWLTSFLGGKPQAVSFDLPGDASPLGRLVIKTDAVNEVSEVWDDMKLKLLIMSSFCVLVLTAVYATLGHALRPLEQLSTGFARVADGQYDAKVSEAGPKELADLYRQFNQMADHLAKAEHQNIRLNEQLLTVQEEERAEIARDLHDEIGPFLFAVDVDAQTIAPLLARNKADEVTARAAAIRQSVGHMQTHLKSILSRLRPATLLDLGLSHAVDQLIAFWQARASDIEFTSSMADVSFGPTIDAVAFRFFQEGTSNAVRHGKPARISLSAERTSNSALRLTVIDNGRGIDTPVERGFGLVGMRERIADLGGTLTVSQAFPSGGVALVADIPLAPAFPLSAANDDRQAGAA